MRRTTAAAVHLPEPAAKNHSHYKIASVVIRHVHLMDLIPGYIIEALFVCSQIGVSKKHRRDRERKKTLKKKRGSSKKRLGGRGEQREGMWEWERR